MMMETFGNVGVEFGAKNECWLGGSTLAFDTKLQYDVGGGGNTAAAHLHGGEGGGRGGRDA